MPGYSMTLSQTMNKHKTKYWWVFLIVTIVGLVDSIYLLWIKLANNKAYCIQGIGDCWTVNTSKYSSVFGIPVSIFGIIGYSLILGVFLWETKNDFPKKNGLNILFSLTFFGLMYSIYLTYIELFVLLAICPFCVISATAMVILFGQTVIRLVKSQATL
jgi:uncharacterized membrane protein